MDHTPVRNLMSCVLQSVSNARILHWNTSSYAEHKALGKFYDELADLADTYAEAYMGIYGRFGMLVTKTETYDTAAELVDYVASAIQAYRSQLPNDTQLQNILDEMAAATDKTAYLLTLK
jgi:DNA-binding ferritin-like protein